MAIVHKAAASCAGRPEFSFEITGHPTNPGSKILLKNYSRANGHAVGEKSVPIGDVIEVVPGKDDALFVRLSKLHKTIGREVKRGTDEMYIIDPYKRRQQEIVTSALEKLRKK